MDDGGEIFADLSNEAEAERIRGKPGAADPEVLKELHGKADALVKGQKDDAGAALEADAINMLAKLRNADAAKYEATVARLKKLGVARGKLEALIDDEGDDDAGKKRRSQADIVIDLAKPALLFADPNGKAFADVFVGGIRKTWPIASREFKGWLRYEFYQRMKSAPNADAMTAALGVIEAKAQFEGETRDVGIRITHDQGAVYIDLCNDRWAVVKVTSAGWEVVSAPSVRLQRKPGMLALPMPVRGGDVGILRKFLNVNEGGFTLIVAWLLTALRGLKPFPILAIAGEQGSAKSTACVLLRRLIDPSTAPLRNLPREDRDLFISASNSFLLVFDNVSGFQPWQSDALCRLATGGGFVCRQLYSDDAEAIINAARPIIVNGIADDVVARPDLAERAIAITLQAIGDGDRKLESDILRDFDIAHAGILGGLLDALVIGLRDLPRVQLEGLPRMADFARFATACDAAGVWTVPFGEAYAGNRAEAVDASIEANPVAIAICAIVDGGKGGENTAAEWLKLLNEHVGEKSALLRSKEWPGTPKSLANQFRRLAPVLRKAGYDVSWRKEDGCNRRRLFSITRPSEAEGREQSQRAQQSLGLADTNKNNGLSGDCVRDRPDNVGYVDSPKAGGQSQTKPLGNNGLGLWDRWDRPAPTPTGGEENSLPDRIDDADRAADDDQMEVAL